MGNKHTPGPWLHVEGERLSHDAEGWSEWEVLPAIVSLESGEIVVPEAFDIRPANARLIAAAPDLLEALRQLTGNAEVARFMVVDPDGYVSGALWDTIQQAHDVIAKATGQ